MIKDKGKKLFKISPFIIQETFISLYNTYQYIIRHGGKYKEYRKYYSEVESLSKEDLEKAINNKKNSFLSYVKKNSEWFKNLDLNELQNLKVLEKTDIIEHLDKIKTIQDKDGIQSLTGGTTGASMKVIYTKEDIQERFAILDHFRNLHGYKLGMKTAWFSGKNLITEKDLQKNRCSHYDFINQIRFYSTFHINPQNFDLYWNSLEDFSPEFIVGFPSSVYEICKLAENRNLTLSTKVKVFFPTAETVLPAHRDTISSVLGCKVVDQYASSEGAPFILECEMGSLHIHPLTGIFEVVDKNMSPTSDGELLVTSFTTRGTPLIRYRIGDRIQLAEPSQKCACGSLFPIVNSIEGRSSDFILALGNIKVNLGNISNCTKDVKGIIKFQVIQKELDELTVLVVANNSYDNHEQGKFIEALTLCMGNKMIINHVMVENIEHEKSGKFRIVKNLLDIPYD